MDNEKKIKLDELPNLGSEPDKIIFSPAVKPLPEPRLENLKEMNDAERVVALEQTWNFDKKRMKWGWLIALLLLVAVEKSKVLADYQKERMKTKNFGDRVAKMVFEEPALEFMMKHPLFFALLIPLFFKFTSSNDDFFDLTFNGVNAVKTINVTAFYKPKRVKMKWGDIKGVKKITVKGREVLELHNLIGPEAQLIWDIDDIKKHVVKQVLEKLVSVKHPLRIFIEKDVT